MKILNLLIVSTLLAILLAPESQAQIPIRETTTFPVESLHTSSAKLPDGRVMVWGGQRTTPAPNNKFWLSKESYIYDPVLETWTQGPDLTAETSGSSVVTLPNGNIVSIGGQAYVTIVGIDSFPQRTDIVHLYDVNTQTWSSIDSVPFGSSPYTGISSVVTPGGNVWLTSTNGDYGTLDTGTMLWTNESGLYGPLDAGGRPLVVLDNGKIFCTGAGGQIYDIGGQQITYTRQVGDPPMDLYAQHGAVVKLLDGRILTWDKGFSFSQEATLIGKNGLTSSVTDSLIIPGGPNAGVRMPNGEVWVFGWGNLTPIGSHTLLQIYDPVNETWSSPGTYSFLAEIISGFDLHLLNDSSLLAISTSGKCYRINAGEGPNSVYESQELLKWTLIHDSKQEILHIQPEGRHGNEVVDFSLIDLQGKSLLVENGLGNEREVSLNGLPAGIYYARLLGKNGAYLVKKIQLH